MKSILTFALLVALLLTLGLALPQQDFSKVKIKVKPVAGNVYMLEGAGGNIGISAGEDGLLMVDDQFAPLAEKIRAAMQTINKGKLEFIINTHYHGDHTGSNAIFAAEASIIAQTNVRARLQSEQTNTQLNRTSPAAPKQAWPVITFAQAISIHFNGEEVKVIHFPHGHTDGDAVVWFTGSNVVHMGDDFFAGRFPLVDLDAGGDVEGLTRNIEAILKLLPADVKLIPGHGPLSTTADLQTFHRMLVETTEIVRAVVHTDKNLEQIKAAGLPASWESWGKGYIDTPRWIETIYRSLTKNKTPKK